MTELPTVCFAALKRLSPEAQQQAALQIKALNESSGMTDQTKALALGLPQMTLTGQPILAKP